MECSRRILGLGWFSFWFWLTANIGWMMFSCHEDGLEEIWYRLSVLGCGICVLPLSLSVWVACF